MRPIKNVVATRILPEKMASITLMKLPGTNVTIAMSTRAMLEM